MRNIVYDRGGFCYVGTITGSNLKITRHCKAGGVAPWGSVFSRNYRVTTGTTAYELLKSFAKGDAA